MLLFAVFLAFLTAVIFMEYEADDTPPSGPLDDNSTLTNNNNNNGVVFEETATSRSATASHSDRVVYCMDTTRNAVVWTILWVLTALLGIREMVQLIQAPLHYVVQVI